MYCSCCGKEIRDAVDYCFYCGNKLDSSELFKNILNNDDEYSYPTKLGIVSSITSLFIYFELISIIFLISSFIESRYDYCDDSYLFGSIFILGLKSFILFMLILS
ncbi:MAG: zinc-ribbon domain-containing protein [Bacilli bacterium]|nr:zinc-ribbon domain-containing protein [Bacilli bacterium]